MFYCLDVSPPKREASLEKFSYAAYEVAKRISLLIFFRSFIAVTSALLKFPDLLIQWDVKGPVDKNIHRHAIAQKRF